MANKHGDFIWYELMTSDAEAAQEFYAAVIGWTFSPAGQIDMDYREFSMNKETVGGLLPLTEDMKANGARPCWLGYVAVNDVDEAATDIEKAGGSIHMAPRNIPQVGRFAMVSDPQGVMFYIMKDSSGQTSNSFAATEPLVGHCAWNELATTDQAGAVAFYTDQFGWRQEGDMDMGTIGKYQFLYQGNSMIAGVMPKVPEMPMGIWSYYFRVPRIDEAIATIKGEGGSIVQEPIEIPGGEFAMSGLDPQGATFSLVGPRK